MDGEVERVNLRPVARAMNEHSDLVWGDGYAWVRCRFQGRHEIVVTDDGVIHVGRAKIRPEDRALFRDILDALESTP